MTDRIPGLFITGTDTSVGKTRISCEIVRSLVARGRDVGAIKPVSTSAERRPDGFLVSPDAVYLAEALGEGSDPDRISPIVLPGDVAPPVAARILNEILDWNEVLTRSREAVAWWANRAEILIVEGVGGLLCPLAERATVADLAITLDYPLVIVARRGLGTLNHTLLAVEAARVRGLRIAGVILNGSEPTTNALAESTNPSELARRIGPIPILAELPHAEGPGALSGAMHGVDWWELARPPRRVTAATSAG